MPAAVPGQIPKAPHSSTSKANQVVLLLSLVSIWQKGFPGGEVVKNPPAMRETQETQV